MKLLLTLIFTLAFILRVFAQTADTKTATPPATGLDENARLMQEYMVRRAEWLDLRRATLDKVRIAKTDQEKKQHRDKLAEDEKPVLARLGEAARAYQSSIKARHDAAAASKPRG